MPQMSPMNWITLFISFSFIFLLMNSNLYFFIKYNFNKSSQTIKFIKLNWKW